MLSAKVITERLEALIAELKLIDLATTEDAELVPLAKAVSLAGAFGGTVGLEIHQRAVTDGKLIPGAIVVTTVTHRKWEDEEAAEKLAREEFGDDAFETKMKSVAAIEKLGKKGKDFVAAAAYKPDGVKVAKY